MLSFGIKECKIQKLYYILSLKKHFLLNKIHTKSILQFKRIDIDLLLHLSKLCIQY